MENFFYDLSRSYLFIKSIRILITVILGITGIQIINRLVNISLGNLTKKSLISEAKRSRIQTLRSIFKSIVGFTISVLLVLVVASDIGFNIIPILTGAGLIGLAFTLGAQSFIKDLISGFFLIFENQINIGDYVEIAGMKGKIIKILMRFVVLEDNDGNIIYVPNSEIKNIVVFRKAKEKI